MPELQQTRDKRITMTETPYVNGIEIGMLKGEVNGVEMKVQTDLGGHSIRFCISPTGRDPEIKQSDHTHPWGKKLSFDPERYADDMRKAQQAAWEELTERNLDEPSEWHVTDSR